MVRLVAPEKWAKYTAITAPQKYFVYRVLELLSENIPVYLDVPLVTFRRLLAEVGPSVVDARAGRVFSDRVRDLFATIMRFLQSGSAWRELLGTDGKDLLIELKKADAALRNGKNALSSAPVRSAELACISLNKRLEQPDGLRSLIQFIQGKLSDPSAKFAYVDSLATLLVSESLGAGLSKAALLRFGRWCLLESDLPQLNERLDSWGDYLKKPSREFAVTISASLPQLVEVHPPHACTILGGTKAGRKGVQLAVRAKDAWTAAFLGYERLLEILEPYSIARPEFVPSVTQRGIVVVDGARQLSVNLPGTTAHIPEFSIEQLLTLERLVHRDPNSMDRETLVVIRAALSQIRESLVSSAESRFLHLWIALETLFGSHLSSGIEGVRESLPIFVAFWSVQKRLSDLWEHVQPYRPALGALLDPVDERQRTGPDLCAWLEVLVNHAEVIAGASQDELVQGRVLWMGGALTRAADGSRPLGKHLLIRTRDDVLDEISTMMRVRGRLVHRGSVDQTLNYHARRLTEYLIRALNAILFRLAQVTTLTLESILSSYRVAFERALETLGSSACDRSDYNRFIDPKPPFV